jgi:chromosome partitioning protein
MSKFVYLGGQKGGTTKTTTAHLLCLGAILRGEPAAYVLTDPHRQIKSEGRPYAVLDGREPQKLAQIITASHSTQNGWLIVDGGGNRPALDAKLTEQADLCILPFRPSEEDLDALALDMQALPQAVAWPSAWPTNRMAMQSAQYFIDGLEKAFPMRVIPTPIFFVNSAAELLSASLDSPSTPVRNAARRAFGIMTACYAMHVKHQTEHQDAAVA